MQQQVSHRLAVLAYDGVVLGDLAIPLETFGRVHNDEEIILLRRTRLRASRMCCQAF